MAADSEAIPPAKHPLRYRILRGLSVFAILLCLFVGLLLFALHSAPARRFAVSKVTSLLALQQIELTTEELRYNLFNLSIDLRNIRLRSARAADLPVFATVGRAQIDLSLPQLLRGKYVVQSGTIEAVDIHYVVDENGLDNLPRAVNDPNESREPLDYLIASLAVPQAHVQYENRAQKVHVELPLESVSIAGDALTDRHALKFDADRGRARIESRETAIERLSGEIDLGRNDLRVVRLTLDALGSHADVSGSVQFEPPDLDLSVKGEIDLATSATFFDAIDSVAGRLGIDATVKGVATAPAVAARLSGSGLQFRSIDGVQLDARAAYDVAQRVADVSLARAESPWGSVAATGLIALDGDRQSRVNATLSGVQAAPLMRAFDLPYAAATRVDGTIQASWPGLEYLKASGEGVATLTPTTTAVARSSIPVGGRVSVQADGESIVARLQPVTAAGAQLTGHVAIDQERRLRGEVRTDIADVARTAGAAEAILGRTRGSLLPVPVSGAARVHTRLSGRLDGPTAVSSIRAPALAVGGATGVALDADVRLAPAALTIARADVTWQQAHAAASGSVGLTGARPLNLSIEADAVDLQGLLDAFNQPGLPVSGTVAAKGTVTGTAARPLATLTVHGSNLVAYEEQLGALNADISVAGSDANVSRLVVDKPQPEGAGQITGSGAYNLQQRTLTAELQSKNLKLLGLRLPGGERIRGDVQFAAHATGTVASPVGTANLVIDGLEVDGLAESASDAADASAPSQWGRVAVEATAANGRATIKASAPRFNISTDAGIGLQHPWPATVKVEARDLDLAALPINLETPLTGRLRATAEGSGTLAEPERGEATATIEAFAGSWNQQPFSITSPSRLRYANGRLDIERLQLAAGDSTLVVSGALPLTDRAGTGDITIDGRGDLATLAQYLPAGTNITGDGAVTVSGTLRGTLKSIDPSLALTVENGLVLSPSIEPGLSNIQLRARIANGVADVEQLTANWGTASIEASAQIPLEAAPPLPFDIPRMGGPATVKVAVRGLNPAAIPGAPASMSGRISLEASASATRADLAALDGRISFSELQVDVNGLALTQQEPSAIAIASGMASVERLTLAGSGGTLTASGTIGLTNERPINLDANGRLEIAGVLSSLTDRVHGEGAAEFNVTARGTATAPDLNGTVGLAGATLLSEEPNIAAENINVQIRLAGRRVELTSLRADVNGGTLQGSGTLTTAAGTVSDIDLQFAANDFAYDAPLELRSLSDSTIRVTRRGDDILVSGQVTIEEAGQTADIDFDEGLLAAINARPALDLTEERNPLLERVQFNIDVDTATPVIVTNNLAQAEVEVDVRVVGTPYETGLTGRLNLLEGAEITLNEQTYEAERGVITFVDERRIVPSVDLRLNTTARNYDVTIAVTGEPGNTEATLTSEPTLPEPDIMALLATGRTLDEMRGEEYEVAREQVLSFLAGRVASRLGRGLERATGLSEVRVEPQLIANETDPTARLTVGQELTDELKLVYSTNLADSNDSIWVAEYDVTRRFQTQAIRQSDDSYRLDFRHDVRFGGEPEPRRQPRQRPTIARLTVDTTTSIAEPELRERFKVKEGDAYDFFAVRRGVERIEERLLEEGYLQSRVRVAREVEGDQASVTLRVVHGPRVDLRFEGVAPASKVLNEIRRQWHRGVFDKQRGEGSVDALRAWLMGDHHLQPKIAYEIAEGGAAQRQVVFRVEPGPRYQKVLLAFEGASSIDPNQLDTIVEQQRLELQLFTDPPVVTSLLERYYREQGYLSAEIDEPRYDFQGATARVVFAVREGPLFTVRTVTTSGNTVFTTDELVTQLPVVAGDPYLPSAAEHALERIRDVYWRKGYNDLRPDFALVVNRPAGEVDVAFNIVEGPQSVIAEIAIEGNRKTSERLVHEQVELLPSEPLDLSALAKSRRNLYDTGAFSIVDITREELKGAQPATAVSADSQAQDQKPVRVNIAVREVQPIQISYGASYDTERGFGGVFDVSNHNSLGKARVVGLQSRYDGELREARLYISQPSLRYWPLKTTGSIYYREELNPPTELTDPFDISRKGASIQQEMELRDAYVWSYGYRYERATTLQPSLGVGVTETVTVSPLTTTLTRETRDEVLDAAKGAFLSQAFSYSPGWLGSDLAYIKYYGQYFHYFPLRAPQRKPFTNEILRPRLVFATGIRVGLARGIGGVVPTSERFYAGGSSTLRGFEQNAVGPVGVNSVPAGGNALLVLNNELRAPLISLLDGVLFVDIGNVFPTINDFSFTDLRESAGVGLRVRTPWFLIRGDYGIALDPRPGERRGRFYFSIGQAF